MEYGSINLAEINDEGERLDSQGANDFLAKFVPMPLKEGFVLVRLLPPLKGNDFACLTRIHKINNRNIHCPRVLLPNRQGKKSWQDEDRDDPCVICKYKDELWVEINACDNEKTKKELQTNAAIYRPYERAYINAIVRSLVNKNGDVEKNVGPRILSVGNKLWEKIVRAIRGDKKLMIDALGDVADVHNGRDLKIIKKISKGEEWGSYDLSTFEKPSPLGTPEQIEMWMSNLHDLAALRVIKSTEEIKLELKKHLGIIKEDKVGFDLSEFHKPKAVSIEDQVRAVDLPKPTPKAPEVIQPLPDDVGMADEDFMNEINAIKKA